MTAPVTFLLYSPAQKASLIAKAEPDLNSGCWLWTGSITRHGYGSVTIGGRSTLAHRAAFAAFISDPGSSCVCHKCDIRSCINPDHLFLGSNADNVADRVRKGRSRGGSNRGDRHPMHRLSPDTIAVIRALGLARQCTQRQIAAEYGITQSHVSNILRQKRWAA